MAAKRSVFYNGQTYKVKSDRLQIPDFEALGWDRIEILVWLNQHTYARGRSNVRANPLVGYGGKITS